MELALRMGAVECFPKPVELRTLAECIRQLAGHPPEAAASTREASVTGQCIGAWQGRVVDVRGGPTSAKPQNIPRG